MSINRFQNTSNYAQENKDNDDISEYSNNIREIPAFIPDFMDSPIHAAINSLLKEQLNIKYKVKHKESMLQKLENHVISATAPRDLTFKFGGFKQYPNSIPVEIRQDVNNREMAILNDSVRRLLEERINVLKEDLINTKNSLYTQDNQWIIALQDRLPVIRSDVRLVSRANQLLQAALVTMQLKERLRAERAVPTPIPARDSTNQGMAVDATSDSIASLTAAVSELQLQMKSLTNHRTRSKNEYGSGSASIDQRRNHAAPRRSTSHRSRSRSRTRQSNTSTPHTGDHTPRSRYRHRPHTAQYHAERGTQRTPLKQRSGTPQRQHRTTRSRSTGRTPPRNSRPPARDPGKDRRRVPYEHRTRRK